MAETEVLILRLIGENKQLRKKLKETNKSVTDLGRKVGAQSKKTEKATAGMALGWAAVAAAVVKVGQAVFRFGKQAVAAAANFEEANAKFKTVFRGVSVRAIEMREELVKSYAQSRTEATKFLAAAQDLFVPLGIARDRAAELSGEVVKLAADIGSFNKLPTADVMRDIQSAMVGNFETVRKYGVVLSVATIKQAALEQGFIKTGEEMDAQTKALVALKLIQEGSADAVGDMIRTGDSFSNTMKKMRAVADDFMVVIGTELIAAIKPTLNEIAKFVQSGDKMDTVRKIVKGIIGAFKILGRIIIGSYELIWEMGRIFILVNKTIGKSIAVLAKSFIALFSFDREKIKEAFVGGFSKVWDEVEKTTKKSWNNIADIGKDVAKNFKEGFLEENDDLRDELKESAENDAKNQQALIDARLKAEKEKNALLAEEEAIRQEAIAVNIESELEKVREKHAKEIEMFRALQKTKAEERTKALELLAKEAEAALKKGLDLTKRFTAQETEIKIAEIDKQLAARLAEIDQSTASEVEKEALRTDAKKKASRERSALALKQWKFEKKLAITTAFINAALAVVKALTGPFPLVRSALIGGLAAAEIAMIQKQPAPAPQGFQFGGVAGQSGPQIIRVGEVGPELVLNAAQTAQLAAMSGGGDTTNNVNVGGINVDGSGDPAATGDAVAAKIAALSDGLGRRNILRA